MYKVKLMHYYNYYVISCVYLLLILSFLAEFLKNTKYILDNYFNYYKKSVFRYS